MCNTVLSNNKLHNKYELKNTLSITEMDEYIDIIFFGDPSVTAVPPVFAAGLNFVYSGPGSERCVENGE